MVVQAGGLLIINLIMFYLFDALQKFYVQKQEKEILEQQLALYDNELEIIKRSYDNIRALRHDMKHHLIELKFLSKEGSHEMISYIEKMEQSICNPEQYVDSGNRDLDSTLNYLLQKAERLLNKTEIHIVLPENLPIHPFTMNVIMGNLLDNAIEASEKSEEKYLGLNIKVKRGLLFIKVENSFTNEIEVKNNRIITTKKDKQKHGIGLKSVRHIVEEEGGIMNISWEENIFCVTVMLYLYLPKE